MIYKERDLAAGGTKPFCSVRVSQQEEGDTEGGPGLAAQLYQTYCVLLVTLQYLAPLSVISLAYCRMGIRLWGAATPGTVSSSGISNLCLQVRPISCVTTRSCGTRRRSCK